jgi:glutamate:Na+ symporter, ESS family
MYMISFSLLCVLLVLGNYIRLKWRLMQRLYLPSCVIGGVLGLIIIQVFRLAAGAGGWFETLYSYITDWTSPWGQIPGLLINIVFACLFLGVKIPGIKTIWQRSGPQVAYGQLVAWGQYVVAIVLWIFVLRVLFPDLPAMFAGVLPVGFEGGHGTAGGLGPTFDQYNWPAGKDFALTSATFGIVSAIIAGTVLINWAVRKGYTIHTKSPVDMTEDDTIGIIPVGQRPSAGRITINTDIIEAMSVHLGIVGIACLIGIIIQKSLVGIENSIEPMAKLGLLKGFPLFPLCMIGGLTVQKFFDKYDTHNLIDLGLIRRIQNTALDFLVVAAIATIRIELVAKGIVPLVLLAAVGIAWNVGAVVFIARKFLPDAWFERAIAEMGQSMGVTATGLLLLRVVDPDYKTSAADAFAYKQILHEPIMGGGLWTGMAIPLLALKGGWFVLSISASAMIIWLAVLFVFRYKASANTLQSRRPLR